MDFSGITHVVPKPWTTCAGLIGHILAPSRGFLGHNRHSCAHRNMATHIAMCLATLVDSTKSARITPRSAHLSLYHCYHAGRRSTLLGKC